MQYVVRYLSQTGELMSLVVEARSPQEAAIASGIPQSRIVRVRRSLMSPHKASRLNANTEAMLLQMVSAITLSGLPAADVLKTDVADQLPESLIQALRDENANTPDTVLKAAGVNAITVTLVAAGKKGDMRGALNSAIAELRARRSIGKALDEGIMGGVAYITVGGLVLLLMPLLLAPIIEGFIEAGMKFPATPLTHVILGINTFVSAAWFVLFPALGLLAFYYRTLWEQLPFAVRRRPLFKLFHNLQISVRSVSLLLGFTPLYKAEVPHHEAVHLLTATAQNRFDARLLERTKQDLVRGTPLAIALNRDEFSPTLRLGIMPFDKVNGDERDLLLRSLSESLIDEAKEHAITLSTWLSWAGRGTVFVAVMVIILGFYLPNMFVEPPR